MMESMAMWQRDPYRCGMSDEAGTLPGSMTGEELVDASATRKSGYPAPGEPQIQWHFPVDEPLPDSSAETTHALGLSRRESATAARTPSEGTLLGGVYRVIGHLGEGAMGVILLARDEQLQRDVAIKLLRPDQVSDQVMQARLLDEARAMARVHHPNVVQIHAFGEHEGAPYFVMQYVDGVTLDKYVALRGGAPLVLDEALSILDQVCVAVAALHAAGIAHRDLKPSNILVGAGLRVLVADLGLARKVSHDNPWQIGCSGTPAYLAPEVALQSRVDPDLLPRVDVYALGLLAYLLLAGRLPFDDRSVIALIEQHAYQAPAAPSAICPALSSAFDAPLLAALVKDPSQRTESAEALREALFAARCEAPVSLRPLRVVIADDDPAFRAFVTEVVKSALPGAAVEQAWDGAMALTAIKRRRPELAIFDLDMPGLNGIELTEAVRSLPDAPDFPIIVATGTGGAAEWQRLARLGASAFLVKPFDAGQLITLARGLVSAARGGAPAR
jgi:serine/threonine-protein kinase